MMRWNTNATAGHYDILLDGVVRVENQKFIAGGDGAAESGGIAKVGVYVLGQGQAWFDEIYLGPDFTMGAIWNSLVCGGFCCTPYMIRAYFPRHTLF